MHKWSLHEAKNKLSNLVDIAARGQPQIITKRGIEAVVVIGMNEYQTLQNPKVSLKEFLLQEPKFDDLEIGRPKGKAREVDL
jgi:prevent-host-death family protein